MYGSAPWTIDSCPVTSASDVRSVADDLAWLVALCLLWQGLKSVEPGSAVLRPCKHACALTSLCRRVVFSGNARHSGLKIRQEEPCSSIRNTLETFPNRFVSQQIWFHSL